ncbi:glycosyl transferase family 90-domain-containing protein [Mycena maculata]|uniref:Glycosyl transferase family 90-domain-containing protein n=1 Tax=Mycena maculata TaxID=230809 RepID=A0AAD7HWX6_9AGAR|nr:glycosyl transferase family 90-domain-containing protein [Mycena maculata]
MLSTLYARARSSPRRWTYIGVLLTSLSVGTVIYASLAIPSRQPTLVFKDSNSSSSPPVLTAVDELFERQSATLDEAIARYTLRTGRPPPPNYDRWFRFAKAGQCLIDDYDQLYDDFTPFHQLAKHDPTYFRRMVERGIEIAKGENLGMRTFKMRNHKFDITDSWPEDPGYVADWMVTIRNLSAWLPDMDLPISMRDECRVQVNVRDGRSVQDMLDAKDPTPFTHRPHPTFTYYTDEGHCLFPNDERGFVDYANNVTAFFLYSTSQEFSTDLYPILSQGKIHPCFSDILFPSTYYYKRSPSYPKTSFPDNIAWADKEPVLYWRGRVAGGMISGENYRAFPRFRLISLAHAHPGTMDVALTGWNTWCDGECDLGAIEREYGFDSTWAAREDIYRYKYAMDLDGHGWSGRFLGLLTSGSLVFKSTVFTEYFSQWLRPFEHYIPVRPDLSDLVSRLEWARAHDEEARRIQRAGKEFVDRVMTDAQNDCYFFLMLLEWARLQNESAKSKWWWWWST